MKNNDIAKVINDVRDIARDYGQTQQLRQRLSNYLLPLLQRCLHVNPATPVQHIIDHVREGTSCESAMLCLYTPEKTNLAIAFDATLSELANSHGHAEVTALLRTATAINTGLNKITGGQLSLHVKHKDEYLEVPSGSNIKLTAMLAERD